MPLPLRPFLIWAPRVLAVAMALFLGMFALDAFDGQPPGQALPAVALHLLPSAIVIAVLAAAWRHPWLGAAAFAALALAYALMTPERPDWTFAISGPLALIAALFALSAAGNSPTAGRRAAARL